MKKTLAILTLLILCPAWVWGADCSNPIATNECGCTLASASTTYTLSDNMTCTNAGAALTVGANSIVLNLSGKTLIGDATNTTIGVINNGYDIVTITNGFIRGFTANDVALSGTTDNNTISSITFGDVTAASGRQIIVTSGAGIAINSNIFNQPSGSNLALITTGTPSHMTFSNNTLLGAIKGTGRTPEQALYFYQVTNLVFTGNTITDWDLNAATDKIVYLRNITGGTFSGNVIGTSGHANDGNGYYIQASTELNFTGDTVSYFPASASAWYWMGTSTGTMTNCTAQNGLTGGSNSGFDFVDSVVALTNCYTNDNPGGLSAGNGANLTLVGGQYQYSTAGVGVVQTGTGIISATGTIANNNSEDGFSANNTGSLSCFRCLSYNNGTIGRASSGDGFTAHDTPVVVIANSIAYGNQKSGYASATGHTGGAGSTLVNNSFYNNYNADKAGTGGGIDIPSAGIWTIKNNITYGHDREIRIGTAAGGTYSISNNMHYGSLNATPYNWNGTAYSWANWVTASATGCGGGSCSSGSLNADPLWVSTVTPDYHLQLSSPAVGTGVNLGATYATDFDGVTQGCHGWDIGALTARLPNGNTCWGRSTAVMK